MLQKAAELRKGARQSRLQKITRRPRAAKAETTPIAAAPDVATNPEEDPGDNLLAGEMRQRWLRGSRRDRRPVRI